MTWNEKSIITVILRNRWKWPETKKVQLQSCIEENMNDLKQEKQNYGHLEMKLWMTWNKESEEESQYKEIFWLTEFAENKI